MTPPKHRDDEPMTLEPCPFCGPGQSQVDLWFDDVAKRWRVGCGRCGCSTGISPRDKTQAPAIEAWNRRHRSASSPQETGWRTIDSAPKDGTYIIGGRAEKRSKMMWWETQSGGGGRWLIDDGDFSPAKPQPTHWQPVPEFMK